jgi:hypothetical protein
MKVNAGRAGNPISGSQPLFTEGGGNPLILLQKRGELAICQDSHNEEGTIEETNEKKNAG